MIHPTLPDPDGHISIFRRRKAIDSNDFSKPYTWDCVVGKNCNESIQHIGGGGLEIGTTHIAASNVGSANFNVLFPFVEKNLEIKVMFGASHSFSDERPLARQEPCPTRMTCSKSEMRPILMTISFLNWQSPPVANIL